MKKLRFTLTGLFLLLLTSHCAFAQKVSIDWGDVAKRKSFTAEATEIAGRDETGYYVIAEKSATTALKDNSKVYLEKYNNKNEQVYSVELAIPSSDGKKVKYERTLLVKDKLLLFCSFYNKDKGKNFAFLSTIDRKTGKVNKDLKRIGEMDAKSKRKAGKFAIELSPDSSKILVYEDYPDKKSDAESFGINVIDLDGKSIYQDDATMPFKEKDFEIRNYTVSNDGRVFVLAKIQEGRREKKGGKPNYRFTILSYAKGDRKPTEYLVSLGDKFISAIMFKLNNEGDLLCTGLYSDKGSHGVGGAFTLTIDQETKAVTTKNIKDFDEKALALFMSEKKAKKGKETGGFEMRKLIPTADGGSVLIAEQYWVRVVERQQKSGASVGGLSLTYTTYDYYYYYCDIMAVYMDKTGNIKWVSCIPKRQVSMNDEGFYSSFAMNVYKDKIYMVYNDNKKNAKVTDRKRIKWMKKPKSSAAMLAVIDGSTGEYTKEPLFNLKEKDAYLKPKLNLQTKPDEMVIYARKNRAFMFGTMKFQ